MLRVFLPVIEGDEKTKAMAEAIIASGKTTRLIAYTFSFIDHKSSWFSLQDHFQTPMDIPKYNVVIGPPEVLSKFYTEGVPNFCVLVAGTLSAELQQKYQLLNASELEHWARALE
jgi:hypothetical protein